MKKKILGTSDAWSMSRLSQQTSKPTYYILDWRIFSERTGKKILLYDIWILNIKVVVFPSNVWFFFWLAGLTHDGIPIPGGLVAWLTTVDEC